MEFSNEASLKIWTELVKDELRECLEQRKKTMPAHTKQKCEWVIKQQHTFTAQQIREYIQLILDTE